MTVTKFSATVSVCCCDGFFSGSAVLFSKFQKLVAGIEFVVASCVELVEAAVSGEIAETAEAEETFLTDWLTVFSELVFAEERGLLATAVL